MEELRDIVRGQPNEALVRSIVWTTEAEPTEYLKKLTTEFAECFDGRWKTKVVSFHEKWPTKTTIKVSTTLSSVNTVFFKVTVADDSMTERRWNLGKERACTSTCDGGVSDQYRAERYAASRLCRSRGGPLDTHEILFANERKL